MSEDEDTSTGAAKPSIKSAFQPGKAAGKPALFTSDEMDIYCNKVTLETYIFHGKDVDYDPIAYLEYDKAEKRVDIVMKDNTRMDLGVKIQWLVRPYFTKAKEVSIVQTKGREPIDGTVVPLIHKGDAPPKNI
ncbi:MAG: hypothetical protein ACRBCT_04660 [Alphaproteobacteria bacterium]